MEDLQKFKQKLIRNKSLSVGNVLSFGGNQFSYDVIGAIMHQTKKNYFKFKET